MRTPVFDLLDQLVDSCQDNRDGQVAQYIPELADADPEKLALALCTPDGRVYTSGDAEHEFTMQSISKPFTYALALRDRGLDRVLQSVDVEPSGNAFNEISLDSRGRAKNPMINIGAITTYALAGDDDMTAGDRLEHVLDGLSQFAGRELSVAEDVYQSELSTGWRNLALAALMKGSDLLVGEPQDAMHGYTRACAINVDARDVAVMGMTLATGGVNPLTKKRVIPQWVARQVLSVMTTCGMYDSAGDWLSRVGIPAKSGVSGGVLGALPGQVGIGAFSPRLDRFGNSVRGVKIYERLSHQLGLHIMNTPAPSIEAVGQRSHTSDGYRLIDLQGRLTFATAEMALRHFQAIPPGRDDVVVDFSLVPAIPRVGAIMILEGLRRLRADGHAVILVDPHGRVEQHEEADETIATRIVDALDDV